MFQFLAFNRLGADPLGFPSRSGEAFVLSNPRLPDQPIVLASPAFCKLTVSPLLFGAFVGPELILSLKGYSPDMIVGRNCRFLQGEATAPSSVKTIKEALLKGEEVTQLLLNYKLDGTPFWNLLCCIPLHDSNGELTYFIVSALSPGFLSVRR